jgi:hypothetical protein
MRTTYIISNNQWCIFRANFVKVLYSGGGHRFESGRLQNFDEQTKTNNKGVTWQPMTGPRGTTPFAENDATCHNTIRPDVNHQCLPRQLPHGSHTMPCHHVKTCHVSVRSFHVSIRIDCTDCPVSIRFLPVWRFEQIAISFAPDVRLR